MAISKINPNSLGGVPCFSAYATSPQTPSSGVNTKIQFNTEEFDTANCYDNATNYRFTPNVAGYYLFVVSVLWNSITSGTYQGAMIYKNGNSQKATQTLSGSLTASNAVVCTAVVYMNGSTDYVEGYCYHNGTATTNPIGTYHFFQGTFVRAA